MVARCMVSRAVTSDPPTGVVQVLQQVTAHGGGQKPISGQTGGQRSDALNARPQLDVSRSRSAGPSRGGKVIGAGVRGRGGVDESQISGNSGGFGGGQQAAMVNQISDSQQAGRHQAGKLSKAVQVPGRV